MEVLTAWFMASALVPLFAISFLILWAVTENGKGGWATFLTLITLGLGFYAFPSVVAALGEFGIGKAIGLYALAGLIWASTKWFLHLYKVRSTILNMKEEYIQRYNLNDNVFSGDPAQETDEEVVKHNAKFAKELRAKFRAAHYMPEDTSIRAMVQAIKPKASEHKADIVMWAAYWPTSIVWFVLADMVTHLGNAIYRFVSGTFQNMSDRMFKNIV